MYSTIKHVNKIFVTIAAERYLQLYPNRRQPRYRTFNNIYDWFAETGQLEATSRTSTSN